MGKIFYISDLHFDHANCLHFDARPCWRDASLDGLYASYT